MRHNHERRGCGFADVVMWRLSNSLDPINPNVVDVIQLNNSLVTFPLTSSPIRNVFDQQPHIRTLHGAPNFLGRCSVPYAHQRQTTLPVESTGKVLSRFGLANLTVVLLVGRLGADVRQLVPPLGSRSDA